MVEAALVAQLDNYSTADIAESVRQSLVARIGQERLNLWFGANAIWKFDQSGLTLDLENSFLLDCVKSFCWDELKCAVVETIDDSTPIRLVHTVRLKKPEVPHPAVSPTQPSQLAVQSPLRLQSPYDSGSVLDSGNSAVQSSPPSPHSGYCPSPSLVKLQEWGNRQAGRNLGAYSEKSSTIAVPFEQDKSSDYLANPSQFNHPAANFKIVSSSITPTIEPARGSGQDRHRAGRESVRDVAHWNDFIAGASNRLAYTAAEMILERPGTLSPLLLHGGSGVGKTHLAKAIAEQLRIRHGLRRVLFMTAEQFTIDYSESARGGGFASFRKKYRDVDGFVLDDLAFCIGKHQTLSELRNTIDNLIRNNKQVILVSDRPLNELTGLGSDLHARISGGMTCNMDPLDSETRRELLDRLIKQHAIELPSSAVETLAKSCGGDGRALFGVAFRLLAQQRSLKRPLTHDESITASLDLIRACQPVVRITDIEKAVCDNFRLDPKCLQEKGKAKTVSAARMLAMFLARKHTQAAYAEIGEYFGHRQHSTVISAHRKVQQWLDTNTPLQRGSASISVRDVIRSLETALQVG